MGEKSKRDRPTREMVVKCNHATCPHAFPFWTFRPLHFRDQPRFLRALEEDDYDAACSLRASRCISCRVREMRASNDPYGTGIRAKCKRQWYAIYNDMARRGCAICGATDQLMEADHINEADKTHELSHYVWWTQHGGAAAMFAEYQNKCQPLCRPCNLSKAHEYARRAIDDVVREMGDAGIELPETARRPRINRL